MNLHVLPSKTAPQTDVKKFDGPKTAHAMWVESKSILPFSQWTPTTEQQEQLDRFFGER